MNEIYISLKLTTTLHEFGPKLKSREKLHSKYTQGDNFFCHEYDTYNLLRKYNKNVVYLAKVKKTTHKNTRKDKYQDPSGI